MKEDGWYLVKIKGDHHQFKHPIKKGKVTVQHPVNNLKKGVIKSIERQSGVKLL